MKNIVFGFALVVAAILPSSAKAQTPVTQTASAASSQTYLDFQVEQPVKIRTATAPVYPDRLKNAGVEGQVIVQFVVDESGRALMESFKVLRSNDDAFSESVRKAVSNTTYFAAEIQGKKVRQLVQQPYKFASK